MCCMLIGTFLVISETKCCLIKLKFAFHITKKPACCHYLIYLQLISCWDREQVATVTVEDGEKMALILQQDHEDAFALQFLHIVKDYTVLISTSVTVTFSNTFALHSKVCCKHFPTAVFLQELVQQSTIHVIVPSFTQPGVKSFLFKSSKPSEFSFSLFTQLEVLPVLHYHFLPRHASNSLPEVFNINSVPFNANDAWFSRHAESRQVKVWSILQNGLSLNFAVNVVAVQPHPTELVPGLFLCGTAFHYRKCLWILYVLVTTVLEPLYDGSQADFTTLHVLQKVLKMVTAPVVLCPRQGITPEKNFWWHCWVLVR